LECYAAALRIDPAHSTARNNLMLAAPFVADPLREVEQWRSAIADDAGNADAHRNLGIALWACGDADEAQTVLEQARALEPGSAAVHCALAVAAKTRCALQAAAALAHRATELDPNDVYAQAARASIDAAVAGYPPGTRVALHMNQRYHYRILRPVFDALRDRRPALLTPHVKELVDFDPAIVVVAESQSGLLRSRLPRARFVWVRHGLISKNSTCFAARSADFACLTSEASRDWYVAQGGRPRCDFWITGYPQMDALFRNAASPIPVALPPGHKKVLYAPTWNAALSSAPMLGERVVELVRGTRRDVSLLIKPHPATADHHPDWLATWRRLAAADHDVHLIDDPAADVMSYLAAADLLVSDASSVIFEYLALDRPIVILTNPSRHRAPTFDPNGIEWRWRDVGVEVHDVNDLPAAVSAALDNPASVAARRAHYREELFGKYTDGYAAERIAGKIMELDL
jgi:tetratricopeptide (TPR) repeat protein